MTDQKNQIITHLKENGSITKFEAFNLYKITNLGDVILKLRRSNDIITIMKKSISTGKRYAKYVLNETRKEISFN